MKLFHRSKYYLFCSILRANILRILRFSNFNFKTYVLIGENSSFLSKSNGKISIGNKSFFFDNVEVQSRGDIKIGENVQVNNYSRIIALEKIVIGDNVTIAQFVSILDHDHDYTLINGKLVLNGYSTKPITIGNNVWIADKVTILKGVHIGDNVIIGANSLVNKDIPDNSVVGGIPVKILKKINDLS